MNMSTPHVDQLANSSFRKCLPAVMPGVVVLS